MGFALFIAKRISLSEKGKSKAPAVAVAIAAVALAIGVMLASISIVVGFKDEIKAKVTGFNGHISLYSNPLISEEDNIIRLTPELKSILDNQKFINDYSLQLSIPAILKTPSDFKGVYLKGFSGENTKKFILNSLDKDSLENYPDSLSRNEIYISRIAANQLNLSKGDKIDTYFISDDIRVRRLEIVGIFNSHFDQYDDIIIYGSLPLIQDLANININEGTSIQLMVNDFNKIPEYSQLIFQNLQESYDKGEISQLFKIDNVLNQGINFFSWLELLDTNVIVIIILMIVVASVTLISGMLIIILEKKRFIGILKALGCLNSKISRIFILLALRISLIGLLIGNLISLLILFIQDKTHFIPLDAESYYINFVPVRLDWQIILFTNLGVLFLVYLVLVFPSGYVAKISPAETIKKE